MIPVRQLSWAAAAVLALVVPVESLACSGSAHIELRESGVYALDQAALAAAQPGLADCRSGDLVLAQRGKEVPLRIVGDRDGAFGPGAHVEWVGEALHGPLSWFDAYSLDNVYILSARPGAHLRFHDAADGGGAVSPRLSRRVHFEEQNELIRLNRATMKEGEEPDVWQWAKLTHVDPQPFTFEFDLPDLASSDRSGATVETLLNLRGISLVTRFKPGEKPVDHVVEVQLNGKPAATLQWDGRDEVRKKIQLPRAAFKPSGNVLSLRVPERRNPLETSDAIIDQVMFNWVEVDFPVAGDLAASAAPLRATGDPGAVASIELRAPAAATAALYSAAGTRHPARAAGDRLRFDRVARGVDLFPVVNDALRHPTLVRAVSDDLRATGDGYDYLMIAHRSLIDAVRPLAEFHRRNGLKVALLDVDAVYDAFNGGIPHPSAIRDLILWGLVHWHVKPRYALLVGSASFDIREAGKATTMQPSAFDERTGVPFTKRTDNGPDRGPASRNLIPTWQIPSDSGQSASDNPYVVFGGDDFHPSLAIGRFPVVTAAEAEAVVRKTIDYASAPSVGPWRHRVMMIANENEGFQKLSDGLATELGGRGFVVDKVYGNPAEADNLAHQAEITDSLNKGDLLVHFLGHGGRLIWRTGPPDFKKNHDLFTLDDVSRLHNGGRLPVVLSMTCFSAPFDNPSEDSIGERFLREPGRGAVAVLAASWTNSPSTEFSKNLLSELMVPGRPIGDSIVAAKRPLTDRTLVQMYNLLGDPALVLEQPQAKLQLVRSGDRWQDRISVRVPEADFGGVVTVDWLDAEGGTLQSRTYESRDQQFELAVPDAAASVRVYAGNLRTHRDAFGSLELRAPPPPTKAVTREVQPLPAAKPAAPAPRVPPPAAPRPTPPAKDAIGRSGFDPAAGRTASAGADAPRKREKVAVRTTAASASRADAQAKSARD